MVRKRRTLINQQGAMETKPQRKKDFVDIILLSKVGAEMKQKHEDFVAKKTNEPKKHRRFCFYRMRMAVA